MSTVSIFASMRAPMKYAEPGACCNCGASLSAVETYTCLCQSCNEEIDRRANEVLGNAEDDDG